MLISVVLGLSGGPLLRHTPMAAELCVPGCVLCLFRPCPLCRGDAPCERCWSDLRDILWLEEWEADAAVADEDEAEALDGVGGADGAVYAGTSTTCPPTDDLDVDIAEATSDDD